MKIPTKCLSDILKDHQGDMPKYPEKTLLPIKEFQEFYFQSAVLNHLKDEDRLWLAVMDVLAGVYSIIYNPKFHEVSSILQDNDIMDILKNYYKKLEFLKQNYCTELC